MPPPSGSGAGQLPSGGGGYGGGMNSGMGGGSGGQPIPNHHCARGAEGYFSFGCSSRFFACLDGNAVTIDCPAGLFYDNTRGLCDYSTNVPACGGNSGTMQ